MEGSLLLSALETRSGGAPEKLRCGGKYFRLLYILLTIEDNQIIEENLSS